MVGCECTNIKLSHLSTQVHAAAWSMEGTSVYSRTPLPHPAAITTSKHLLHLQGRLCCAWRGFSFQVTHTERFAAYVMIGCVKLILWFQGCLWLRTVRSIWEIPTSEMWGIFFLFFYRELAKIQDQYFKCHSTSFLWEICKHRKSR